MLFANVLSAVQLTGSLPQHGIVQDWFQSATSPWQRSDLMMVTVIQYADLHLYCTVFTSYSTILFPTSQSSNVMWRMVLGAPVRPKLLYTDGVLSRSTTS